MLLLLYQGLGATTVMEMAGHCTRNSTHFGGIKFEVDGPCNAYFRFDGNEPEPIADFVAFGAWCKEKGIDPFAQGTYLIVPKGLGEPKPADFLVPRDGQIACQASERRTGKKGRVALDDVRAAAAGVEMKGATVLPASLHASEEITAGPLSDLNASSVTVDSHSKVAIGFKDPLDCYRASQNLVSFKDDEGNIIVLPLTAHLDEELDTQPHPTTFGTVKSLRNSLVKSVGWGLTIIATAKGFGPEVLLTGAGGVLYKAKQTGQLELDALEKEYHLSCDLPQTLDGDATPLLGTKMSVLSPTRGFADTSKTVAYRKAELAKAQMDTDQQIETYYGDLYKAGEVTAEERDAKRAGLKAKAARRFSKVQKAMVANEPLPSGIQQLQSVLSTEQFVKSLATLNLVGAAA